MKALSVILFILAGAVLAAPTLTEETREERTVYRLENARLIVVVDPAMGGTVVEFRDRRGGDVDLLAHRQAQGIGIDHFQSQSWPGEMHRADYEVIETTQADDRAAVTMRYVATGRWRTAYNPKLEGLVLEKTWRLEGDRPGLFCHVRIAAPETGSKLFAYWQQSIVFAGGDYDRDSDFTYRPTTRGVRVKAGENNGHTGNEDWIRDFSAGWMALLDSDSNTGLALLADYDQLDVLYMNRGNYTMEPMYRRTFLPPGKSTEFDLLYVPLAGLDNVVSTTRDYVAGYKMASDAKGNGAITFSLVRSVNEPSPVRFDVRVASGLDPEREVDAGTIEFPAPGLEAVTGRVEFRGAGADPLVVRVTATVAGEPPREYRFEEYFNGTWKWGENLKTDMISPIYRGERPPQAVTLQKPAKLERRYVYSTQFWYVEGFMDDYYDIARAARMIRQEHEQRRIDRNFVSYTRSFRTRLDGFPWDYEELLGYDFIILGGVKEEALGLVGIEMLGDFVDAGGGLLVLGGPMAYGASRLHDTPLVAKWPVEVPDRALNLERLDNAVIEPVGEADFLEHLDWSAQPRVQYVHKLDVKPEGRVVLAAAGHPFLVIRETAGGGRVACLLGAPLGSMTEGQTPFWEWSDWPYLLRQLCWWLENDKYADRFEAASWAP